MSLPGAHHSLIQPVLDRLQVPSLLTSNAEVQQAGLVGEKGGQAAAVRQLHLEKVTPFVRLAYLTRFRRLSRHCQT